MTRAGRFVWVAVVASALVAVGGGVAAYLILWGGQGQAQGGEEEAAAPLGPAMVVGATYPGASAAVVRDAVAVPIEQQFAGLAEVAGLSSRSTGEGEYSLEVAFRAGTSADAARAVVRRLERVREKLPDLVQRQGLSLNERSRLRMIVCVHSPDGSRDLASLAGYAQKDLRDDLLRVSGVSEVAIVGEPPPTGVRLHLDADRMAARGLTASDVVRALQEQNLQVTADKDDPLRITLSTLGRLTDANELGEIVVKRDAAGRIVRLRDVGSVRAEAMMASRSTASSYQGAAAITLLVGSTADEPAKVCEEVAARLRKGERAGLAHQVVMASGGVGGGAPSAEMVFVELRLPDVASLQRTEAALQRCTKTIRGLDNGARLVSLAGLSLLTEERAANVATLCVLAPERGGEALDDLATRTQKALADDVRDAVVNAVVGLPSDRVPGCFRCDVVAAAGASPADGDLLEAAVALMRNLPEGSAVRSIWSPWRSGPPQLIIDVDREKAKGLGVSIADVFTTLQATLGMAYLPDFNRSGKTWQVRIVQKEKPRVTPDALKTLKVRDRKGEMVSLASIVTVNRGNAPAVIYRRDGRAAVPVLGRAAPGTKRRELRALLDAAGQGALPKGMELVWPDY